MTSQDTYGVYSYLCTTQSIYIPCRVCAVQEGARKLLSFQTISWNSGDTVRDIQVDGAAFCSQSHGIYKISQIDTADIGAYYKGHKTKMPNSVVKIQSFESENFSAFPHFKCHGENQISNESKEFVVPAVLR